MKASEAMRYRGLYEGIKSSIKDEDKTYSVKKLISAMVEGVLDDLQPQTRRLVSVCTEYGRRVAKWHDSSDQPDRRSLKSLQKPNAVLTLKNNGRVDLKDATSRQLADWLNIAYRNQKAVDKAYQQMRTIVEDWINKMEAGDYKTFGEYMKW